MKALDKDFLISMEMNFWNKIPEEYLLFLV